jgi:hypothetical protein
MYLRIMHQKELKITYIFQFEFVRLTSSLYCYSQKGDFFKIIYIIKIIHSNFIKKITLMCY